MDKQQAINIVRETFESPFEKGLFIKFVKNLLNQYDEAEFVRSGDFIPDSFKEFINKYERLGKYRDQEDHRLDILIVYLKRETSIEHARSMQRNFVAGYLQGKYGTESDKDAALVAFVSPDNEDWRFSLVKLDVQLERTIKGSMRPVDILTPARRWSFLVGRHEKSHTAQTQFVPIIADDVNKPNLARLEEAFNIETVTNEFFREYRRIFEDAEATLMVEWSDEKKRLYTQRFFNRLMFVAFLERKGWLSFDKSAGRKDYLRMLYEDYKYMGKNKHPGNFHKSRLNTLFFRGLNNPYGDQLVKDPDYKLIQSLIGIVPYLNGGLFEVEAEDIDSPVFSDDIIVTILNELIYQFNFTVNESTPLDVEVAVDPEMLGRIFEELVTGRHESGSYYTPKPVVAFMCREALKGYLTTLLPSESDEAIALFVDKNDASGLKNLELTLNALRMVKVCDPACGSGAYLLGMLHELLEQRECLFAARRLDAKTIYDRKLEIIQNNLYGVDKDNFAVNIARLRLWLSLIVDYEGETPPPLPNLDFKIESGDSLTAPDPSGGLQPDMFRYGQVQEFLSLKNQFMGLHAGSDNKRKLAKQIQELRVKIEEWAHTKGYNKYSDSFDWQVDFAEVFAPELAQNTLSGKMAGIINSAVGQMEFTNVPKEGGFDIVMANPPYVRADAQFRHIEDEHERRAQIVAWQDFRKQLKASKVYKTLHEKWDLFIPFLERAYQLLCQNGQMIFIIPDAYNAAKYANKSHEFFLQNTSVERIDFCSEINLFDAGVNNSILHFAKSLPAENHQPVRARRWGKSKDEFEANIEILATNFQRLSDTSLFRYSTGEVQSSYSNFELLQNIVYITAGLVIHADEDKYQGEFSSDDVMATRKDKTHPKRFALGKDIVMWHLRNLRWLEWGTKRAPSKFRRQTFPELQETQEKLISVRTPGAQPKTVFDNDKLYFDASTVGFVLWHSLVGVVNNSINKSSKYRYQDPLGDREQREEISKKFKLKYLLAIMNSSFAREWLRGKRRSKMHVYPDDWKHLPIAPISLEEQQEFVKCVDKIMGEYEKHGYPLPASSAEKVRQWEDQLGGMVRLLYE